MTHSTTKRLLILALAIAGFAVLIQLLFSSAPSASRKSGPAPLPLVDVMRIVPGEHKVQIQAYGNVIPAREITIRPQVNGIITAMHADFEPGGIIPANATLLRIEAVDYELALASAQAARDRAEAALAIEQGKRVVAEAELKLLGDGTRLDASARRLALRTPQLRQARADLTAAEQAVKQAELDLARTRLRLPWAVVVLTRQRQLGEVVATREVVGRVTRADTFWVDLKLEPWQLQRLPTPAAAEHGAAATVRDQAGNRFAARVIRKRAELGSGSRLAGALLAVDDPLRLHGTTAAAPLLLGSYVSAEVDAGSIANTVRVPRRALGENGRILVADKDDRLQVRHATVRWRLREDVLLDNAFEAGDRIIISRDTGLVPGTRLRTRDVTDDTPP